MDGKLKVKVIKKGTLKAETQPAKADARRKRDAARDMVANVTNWVSDFQSRKKEETLLAFEKLFVQQPQPNES